MILHGEPPAAYGARWRMLVDTCRYVITKEEWYDANGTVSVTGRATVVLYRPRAET